MDSKISDVTIIELKQPPKKGGSTDSSGDMPPVKYLDQNDDEDDDGEGDDSDKDKGKDKNKDKNKNSSDEDDEGDEGDDGDDGDKSSGSGQGGSRKSPGEDDGEVEPWKPKKGIVVWEVLEAGALGDKDGDDEKPDKEALRQKWEAKVSDAVTQSTGSTEHSTGKSAIQRALMAARRAVVDWREELKKFIDNSASKTDYKIPSRRFLGAGKALPGYKRSTKDFENIVIAIDTSGSISDKMCHQFIAEVQKISETYTPDNLYVMYCHTDLYPDPVDHFLPGDKITVPDLISGGTEFWPPFEWVEENLVSSGETISLFIYFTDGYADFPDIKEYGISTYVDKIIWVIIDFNGQRSTVKVPWGNRMDIILPNTDATI